MKTIQEYGCRDCSWIWTDAGTPECTIDGEPMKCPECASENVLCLGVRLKTAII